MHLLRSERLAAMLLLVAAVTGLVLANTPWGAALVDAVSTRLPIPALGIDLTPAHWVSDGLLAVFFFIVAVELRHELTVGELNTLGTALLPAVAAAGGVAAPALVYLAFTAGSGLEPGWPVPTATDIAFALGILSLFGRWIPTRVRVFLLALAVLDDLVAILIIAVFFTAEVKLAFLVPAVAAIAAFGVLSRLLKPGSSWGLARRPRWPIVTALVVLGVLAWYLMLGSGVHATIAGVALGLVVARAPGGRAARVLEPWSNGLILPLFAFTAALVVIPPVPVDELSPAFWGILVALPSGKLLGISLAGAVGGLVARRRAGAGARPEIGRSLLDLLVVGTLGGIGFTVALLMNELAFRATPEIADEGTLAVLAGSGVSMVAAAIVVGLRSRHYGRELARSASGPPASGPPAR